MAIYHCSVKTISRGAGQSIVAAAAYRHACKLEDDRTGEVHDYSRKRGLEYSSIYLPSGVNASWVRDRERLWNAAESAEKRKDSRLGREIVFALPCELSKEQRRELVGEMADYLAKRYGLAVDVAIHEPSRKGDQRNYHVHMLLSARRITSAGFKEKARELDDHEQGPKEIEAIRGKWASLANQALDFTIARKGIDHRSLKAQGIRRAPTVHLGPSATAMERRGIRTRLGDRNREAAKLNEQVAGLEREQKLQAEALKKQQNEEERLRKLATAPEAQEKYAVIAYVALEVKNGNAKKMFQEMNQVPAIKEHLLQVMEIAGFVNSAGMVCKSNVELQAYWGSGLEYIVKPFCEGKKFFNEKITFEEIIGYKYDMSDTISRYKSHMKEIRKQQEEDEKRTKLEESRKREREIKEAAVRLKNLQQEEKDDYPNTLKMYSQKMHNESEEWRNYESILEREGYTWFEQIRWRRDDIEHAVALEKSYVKCSASGISDAEKKIKEFEARNLLYRLFHQGEKDNFIYMLKTSQQNYDRDIQPLRKKEEAKTSYDKMCDMFMSSKERQDYIERDKARKTEIGRLEKLLEPVRQQQKALQKSRERDDGWEL